MPDNISDNISTTGRVAVGNSLTGEIETTNDSDAYAVELVAGRTYRIDLEGAATGKGTLADPFLRWLRDSSGNGLHGTRDYDGGEGLNPRQVFTPQVSGTYYITASGQGYSVGTYTLRVTDTSAPVFGASAYAFQLAENTDGDATRVSLGTVTATDPDNDPVAYSIVGGDPGGLFAIDEATGGLSYQGSGEDYESETTRHDLTVRASDGAGHSDVTVTVNVTDVEEYVILTQQGANEAPAFVSGSYAFSLAENADGGTVPVALGLVTATDPESSPITYSIEAGDPDGLFAIDPETGALSYRGAGEDYESETRKYELTVRANDGSLYRDVTAIVNVTDVVEEYVSLQQQARVSEPVGEDLPADTSTTGAVAVGGSAGGRIESDGDRDWFAVELVADRSYRIDLEGSGSGSGVLRDSYLYGIHDAAGDLIANTTDDDDGVGSNSRVYFTAEETATYYVAAGAYGTRQGAYRLSVADVTDTYTDDFAVGTGTGGVVEVDGSARGEIEFSGDRDWFAIELVADREYRIDLKGLWTGDGALGDPYLRGIHDANGVLIAGTENDDGGFQYNSRVTFTPTSDGTYYVAAGAVGEGEGAYTLSVADVMDDFAADTGTGGAVEVDGSVRGEIDYLDDSDWFRVTLVAGRSYQIDMKDRDTGHGTLGDPYLRGIHDLNGDLIADTSDDDGGEGLNSRVTFEPTSDGTYYVAAGADGGVGTYTLSVTDITDDYAADNSTTGAVEVDGSVRGEIDYENDRDWFAVTLEADREYRIDLEGSDTGGGTLPDPFLVGIHNEDGDLIAGTEDDDGGIGTNSRVTFTPMNSGTYYVVAYGGGSLLDIGAYTLSVRDVGDYEAGTGTRGAVEVGGSVRSEIDDVDDFDWFRVTLVAGRSYQIDMKGLDTGGGTLRAPYLSGIHDAAGNLIAGTVYGDGGTDNNNARGTFEPMNSGAYYVVAYGGGDPGDIGTYTLSVTDITDDYAAAAGTAGEVAVGGSARGEIDYENDRDWFKVTLVADREYRIDLEGSDTGDGALSDPYLHGVYDADGVLIAGTTNDDGGADLNSRVTFTPPFTDTYYVAAGAWGSRQGAYKLSVTEVVDDFAAGTGTIGTVTVGGSARGEIEAAGDRDWFEVTLEADRVYRIDLEGRSTRAGTLFDPYLRGIHDAEGDRLAGTTNNDGGAGRNSRLYFTPDEAGTYYVAAGTWGSWQGAYKLSVREIVDDFAAGTGTTGLVAVGGSVRGRIELRGDRDWFALDLDAGGVYGIDLEGSRTRAGTLSDPYLYGVHDANGVLIPHTTDDDDGEGHNSRVYFGVDEAGTYYVAAGAWGGGTGTYKLSVVSGVPDDIEAGTGTSGTVAVGGSVTGEVEFGGDSDWFAVELDAGKVYRIDLEGQDTHGGTLSDPYLYGVYDANGDLMAGTTNNNGGVLLNSQVYFTPDEAGTYYVAAGANGTHIGAYTLTVTETVDDFAADTGTSRRGGGGRLGDGRDRDFRWRPRLVRGDARGGQDLPDRPRGRGYRGRHPR